MTKHFTAGLTLCLALGLGHVSATEITSSATHNLPQCINSRRDIAEIQRVQKANAKTPNKYDGYRKSLHASTPVELVARLIYAETLAANCPELNDRIADLVASVIGNRVRIQRGDINTVVFQKNQFASSLNVYSESRYRDFLCPTNGELWEIALERARINIDNSKPSTEIPKDAVNYYLYKHSDRFKPPNWKLEETPIADKKTRECIRVFRDPAWK